MLNDVLLGLFCRANIWLGQVSSPSPEAPLPSASPDVMPVSAPPIEFTPMGGPQFMWWHYLLLALQILVASGLVACVLSQTTKNEGLGGTISGAAQPVFRGKKSSEEKLSGLTTSLAISFLVLSVLVSIAFNHHNI